MVWVGSFNLRDENEAAKHVRFTKKKKKLIEKNQRLVLMSVVCFGAK